MKASAHVGNSGWNYDSWREVFYQGRPRKEWLEDRLAVCQSDAADWPLWDAVTTDLVYVRLHGHTLTYASDYSEGELRAWARRIRNWLGEGCDIHVYFDNDAFGHAPMNALRLMRLIGSGASREARPNARTSG